jgi:hypothetical protein
MGALTEVEIFDQMKLSFGYAIEAAEHLAKYPLKGLNYDKLRKNLRLIEGCCKQANTWREDTRWLVFIKLTSECHQRAGDWLRGIKDPSTGLRIKLAAGTMHPAFVMLADNLRAMQQLADKIKTEKTNRVGMILPAPLAPPHRDTRPVGFRQMGPQRTHLSAGGIIIPDGASVH